MHLSGQLTDWSINDLLQIMQVTNKTGSLDIEGERRGRVHFRDGRVTGAELNGPKGSYLGTDQSALADVLYVLSTLETGSFAVGPADGPDVKGWSVDEVMGEVEALRSLEGEVVDAGLFEAHGVRLSTEIGSAITVEPEDWEVLVTLVSPFTFAHLESIHGRGSAVRILHTLHRLGVAEAIASDEEESQWLDRLAEDVSPKPADEAVSRGADPSSLESTAPREADGEEEREPEREPQQEPQQEPAREPEQEPAIADTTEVTVLADDEDVAQVAPETHRSAEVTGVSAPASTTLTDGVYDEIRRLRSRVSDK